MRKTAYLIVSLLVFSLLLGCGSGEEQRRQLEELERMNRADSVMRNDSLAESLVAYFDRHGTANERMRAYYMLGRTYFDLGELPRALETYLIAADCADTTSADCDYKTLSRIHAQSAEVFHKQIQPRSELKEFKLAEYYGWKGKDTIQAVECYSRQGDCYELMGNIDSLISISEETARCYAKIGYKDRSAAKLGRIIEPALRMKNIPKAKHCIEIYESSSDLFQKNGDIQKGREVYYYIKGLYYIDVNQLDSAEYLFRKELRDGKDLNNQIAGSKGLQEVYIKRGISDSIAKYANLGYQLNDSAYSISEAENIQRLKASYNYQHNKQIAQEKQQKAERAYLFAGFMASLLIIMVFSSAYIFSLYKKKKEKELKRFLQDKRNLEDTKKELEVLLSSEQQFSEKQIALLKADIQKLQQQVDETSHQFEHRLIELEKTINDHKLIKELHRKAAANPYQTATVEDLRILTDVMDDLIPTFYATLHMPEKSLRIIEYQVCILVRFHFKSSEIWKLTGTSDGYVANLKKRIYQKIFGHEGTAKDLENWLMSIR